MSAADLTPAEAVFAFASWLTCRDKAITFGATHNASPAADVADAFIKSQGFAAPRDDYHRAIKPYPCEGSEPDRFEVRIAGPDDVIPFADELAAHRHANAVNQAYLADCLKHPDPADQVLCVATVHARGIGAEGRDPQGLGGEAPQSPVANGDAPNPTGGATPTAASAVPADDLLSIAIAHLAEWCHAIDKNGTGWDDWDEHYKDARHRPGPLRALIDADLAELQKRDKGPA